MEPERRHVQRKRPEGLCYIQFETESGGIAWNASEKGLGFHVVAPIRQSGPIRLCISPSPKDRIEVLGTVVWTDKSKRSGGLQFTELSADTHELIRGWLTQPAPSEIASGEFPLPPLATEEAASIRSNAEHETLNLPPPAEVSRDALPERARVGTIAAPSLHDFLPSTLRESVPRERHLSVFQSRRMYSISAAFLLCVFMLMPIVLLRNFRSDIGNSLIRLGEKLKGNGREPTGSPSSLPVRSFSQDSSNASAPAPPKGEIPSANTPEKPAPFTPVQAVPEAPDPPETHSSELQSVRGNFKDAHTKRGRSAAAQGLWGAVGEGSITAEVALAQLYLKGDGVPRNCAQARVLLRAAAKSGNIAASHQLQGLKRSGCR
jgi:hypothetical protein